MKSWLQEFLEEDANEEFCAICLARKGQPCCGANQWIKLKHLSDENQWTIAANEYKTGRQQSEDKQ